MNPTELFPVLATVSVCAAVVVPANGAVKVRVLPTSVLPLSCSSGCAATTRVIGIGARAASPWGVTTRVVVYVPACNPCSCGVALSVIEPGLLEAVPLKGLTTSQETGGFCWMEKVVDPPRAVMVNCCAGGSVAVPA